MGRDALAELSREQLMELVLALAAEVAALTARQGQPPKAPGNSSVPPSVGCKANWAERRARKPAARAPSGFGGSCVDNQDALPPALEVGAECYNGFSSFLYSRMSPG